MLKRLTRIIPLIIALVFLLSACGSPKEGSFPSESGYTDEQLLLGSVNRFAGVVVSGKETKVEKDDEKTVKTVAVAVGDVVKKGDVLFTYDGTQAQFDYDKAEVELEQLRMSLDGFASQRKELEAEKAKAPASEQLSYTIQIQEIDTSVRETEYNISLKEKELEKMKNSLGDLNVYAPVSGKIQSINNTDTDDSQSGDEESYDEGYISNDGYNQPFMVITQTNAFRIKAFINEENLHSLYPGDIVTVRSRVDETTWEGEISDIDTENPQQDQSGYYEGDESEVTTSSRYPFFVDLKDTKGLLLGQHVYVELYIEEPETFEDEEIDDSGEDAVEAGDFSDMTDNDVIAEEAITGED